MKIKNLLCIVFSAVIIFTALPFCANAQGEEAEYISGEVIFSYTQTVGNEEDFLSTGEANEELSALGITEVKELIYDEIYDTGIKENSDSTKTKTGWFLGYFQGDVDEMCQSLKALDSVDEAVPNHTLTQDEITLPTEVASPNNLYTSYTKWWFESLLDIPNTWVEYNTKGEGIVVAVLDAGFSIDNPEFTGRIWEDAAGNRGYNAVTYTSDVSPDSAHGTNVASIIAGAEGYNYSVIGVAPEAQVIPIKVSATLTYISVAHVVAGLNYAIKNNADIISMSLSMLGSNSVLKAACESAYDAGIFLFASAGNNKRSTTAGVHYPAGYDCVVGVMASGPDGQLCNFSNYDPSLEYYNVAAPGYRILGAYNDNETVLSASAFSGTSQATPIVAGLAALYLSVYPDHTPEEFYRSLVNSSTDTVTSNSSVTSAGYEFPLVNARKLLDYPATTPSIFAIAGTTAVVNEETGFIYGLIEGYASIEEYIGVNDGTIELIPTDNGNGTGSILRVLTVSGDPYKDYEIVIFGDTDGDALCDGRDTLLCDYVTAGGSVPDSIRFACDVDFDDDVDSDDSGIIFRCGLFTDFVSQIR